MSRSYKKNPYIGIAHSHAACHKKCKNNMTRETRRLLNTQEDPPNGAYYKKYQHSYTWRPDDGKYFWENPKAYRK